MSDLYDKNTPLPNEDSQATKQVPAVGKQSLQDVLQRRRVLRQEQDEANAAKTSKFHASPVTPILQEESRVQTRVTPAQSQTGTEVPQPRALSRAKQSRLSEPNASESAAEYGQTRAFTRAPEEAAGAAETRAVHQQVEIPTEQTPLLPDSDNFDQTDDDLRPRSVVPVIAIMVILVLGLLIVGLMMIPDDATGFPGDMKRAIIGALHPDGQPATPVAIMADDFTGMPLQGAAPLEVTFSLTTGKQAQRVRIVDESGEVMNAEARLMTDNADTRVWSLSLMLTQAYAGNVRAQLFDGENWQDTNCTQLLQVAGDINAAQPTETPVVTETPTEEPVSFTTDALTEQPAEATTVFPTTEQPLPMVVMNEQPTEEPTAPPATEQPAAKPEVTLLLDNSPTPVISSNETPVPTAEATTEIAVPDAETPAPTEAATQTPVPTQAAQVTPLARLTAQAVEDTLPEKLLVPSTIYNNSARKLDEYTRDIGQQLDMPAADAYLPMDIGVFTFRGSSFRQNAASGYVSEDLSSMSILWQADMGRVKGSDGKYYYGAGFQSQPTIIKWSTEVRELTNITEEKKSVSALKEVILPGMDGKIYFLDLADGQQTRKPINLGFPMRCAPSVHPYSYPIMAVGQYARKMASGTGKIGLRFYDLLTQKEIYRLDGLDNNQHRIYYEVGAFDTSSLIDSAADTMISLGTNGMLYLTHLNTEFSRSESAIKITPENITMTSHGIGQKSKNAAVESSMAAYQHYMWYADMDGILRCVDTDTLTPIWAVDTGDAVEAAIALRLDEEGQLWLYTANELLNRTKGASSIRCYNALSGECRWVHEVSLTKSKKYTAGVKASPVIGQNQLDGLVYFTVSGVNQDGQTSDGMLIALSADSGKVIWQHELSSYAYSSPVAVYARSGEGWIIQADATGTLEMLDALTGDMIATLKLDDPIESSPAVYGSTLVIATYDDKRSAIYGIALE